MEEEDLLMLQQKFVDEYNNWNTLYYKNNFQKILKSHLNLEKKNEKKLTKKNEWIDVIWINFKEMEVEFDLFDFYYSIRNEIENFELPIEFLEIKMSMKRANFIFKLLSYESNYQEEDFFNNYIRIIDDFFEPIETCFKFEFIQWIFHHERESPLKNFYFLTKFPVHSEYFKIKQFRKNAKKLKNENFLTQQEIEEKIKKNFNYDKNILKLIKSTKNQKKMLQKNFTKEERKKNLKNFQKKINNTNLFLELILNQKN